MSADLIHLCRHSWCTYLSEPEQKQGAIRGILQGRGEEAGLQFAVRSEDVLAIPLPGFSTAVAYLAEVRPSEGGGPAAEAGGVGWAPLGQGQGGGGGREAVASIGLGVL